MSLFVQSLIALATTLSPAPDAPPDAPATAIESPVKVDFAPNLLAKLDAVAPSSISKRPPNGWIQIVWGQATGRHEQLSTSVDALSPAEALAEAMRAPNERR
jgi:hypothetical protein